MVSMGCSLNHQCDSVVPLPLRTGLQSWGGRAGKALSPTFPCQAACVLYQLKENFILFDSAFLAEVLPRLA